MRKYHLFSLIVFLLTIVSCGEGETITPSQPPTPTPGDSIEVPDTTNKDTTPDTKPEDFARGADISWYTQMEDNGKKFYSWSSREAKECPTVMQELGLNAIALRVLVKPKDGYCDLPDLLLKAKKVSMSNMDLLISFHLSDTIATSTLQRTPEEWQGHNADMLTEDIQHHITNVLGALAEEDIHPRWIQIGNQLSQGVLWPEGDITRHAEQYARLINTGCMTARTLFPEAKIIVAAGDPLNQPILCEALDKLDKSMFDQIGLTLYPTLSVGSIFQPLGIGASYKIMNENDAIAYSLQTVDMLYNRYKKECMIVECGVPVSQETASSMNMRQLVSEARKNATCRGVIYWEPEAYEGWMGYTQGAFLSNGHPTQIIDALSK
ncbi:MAG: glycosyl hydrolase 53 family protein [Bacteroidaceae bacterium]